MTPILVKISAIHTLQHTFEVFQQPQCNHCCIPPVQPHTNALLNGFTYYYALSDKYRDLRIGQESINSKNDTWHWTMGKRLNNQLTISKSYHIISGRIFIPKGFLPHNRGIIFLWERPRSAFISWFSTLDQNVKKKKKVDSHIVKNFLREKKKSTNIFQLLKSKF